MGFKPGKVGQTFKCIIDRIEGGHFVGRTEFDSPDVDNEVLIDSSKHYVKRETLL
jgi:ribosomal protein S12 methylthiotransferase